MRHDVQSLAELIRDAQPCVVLTGAGVSTESGIPDFRSPTGIWAEFDPLEYASIDAFLADPVKVWRFYAPRFAVLTEAEPNRAHVAIAELEARGLVDAVITQNIDLLHERAGSNNVVEVHGSIRTCVCLRCRVRRPLAEVVPLVEEHGAPPCPSCAAVLKPDVVFFGENVPRPRVDRCYALVGGASSLLVLGSSLTVMSGLRFVRHARQVGIPVAIINQGVTRGDPLADLKCDAPLGPTLTGLLAALATPALGLRAFVMAARAPETRPEGEGRRAPPPHRVL